MNKYQEALDKAIQQTEVDLVLGDYQDGYLEKEIEDLKEIKKELKKLEEENTKYKTLEQELGIDLVKLFSAKNVYYRIKYVDTNEYSEIEKAHRFLINTLNKEIIVFSSEYDEYGFGLSLKDYGKTYWIEKIEEGK